MVLGMVMACHTEVSSATVRLERFDTRPFMMSTLLKKREAFFPATVPRGYPDGYCQLQTLDTGGGLPGLWDVLRAD